MNACTDRQKTDLLAVLAQRIEQRERLDRSSEMIFVGRLACRIWRS